MTLRLKFLKLQIKLTYMKPFLKHTFQTNTSDIKARDTNKSKL